MDISNKTVQYKSSTSLKYSTVECYKGRKTIVYKAFRGRTKHRIAKKVREVLVKVNVKTLWLLAAVSYTHLDVYKRQTKEEMKQQVIQQLREYREETIQQITETNEKLEETLERLEKTNENISEIREEVINKINNVEGENKRRIEECHEETAKRCEQMDQDIHQVREENQKEIAAVRTDVGERMEGVYSNLNKIDSKVDKNKQRIDEMHRMEESLREELDAWRDRPCNLSLIHI